MFKIVFVIILLVIASYLFLPYLQSLISYFAIGIDSLTSVFSKIIDIIAVFFNSIPQYSYLMLIVSLFLVFKIVFTIVDNIRG